MGGGRFWAILDRVVLLNHGSCAAHANVRVLGLGPRPHAPPIHRNRGMRCCLLIAVGSLADGRKVPRKARLVHNTRRPPPPPSMDTIIYQNTQPMHATRPTPTTTPCTQARSLPTPRRDGTTAVGLAMAGSGLDPLPLLGPGWHSRLRPPSQVVRRLGQGHRQQEGSGGLRRLGGAKLYPPGLAVPWWRRYAVVDAFVDGSGGWATCSSYVDTRQALPTPPHHTTNHSLTHHIHTP